MTKTVPSDLGGTSNFDCSGMPTTVGGNVEKNGGAPLNLLKMESSERPESDEGPASPLRRNGS